MTNIDLSGLNLDAMLHVVAGWFFSGTIASNTLFAVTVALVLFWLLSLVPEPKPRTTRGHYWLEQ